MILTDSLDLASKEERQKRRVKSAQDFTLIMGVAAIDILILTGLIVSPESDMERVAVANK